MSRKGRVIYRQGNIGGQIHILREGWAFRFTMLPNGRRQILEFLLPGDPMLLPLLFVPQLPYTVQGLTEATLCTFSLQDLAASLRIAYSRQIEVACAVALLRAESQLAEINQRNSQERITWLLLSLYRDLRRRGRARATPCRSR
jgi:CRP-like cAMP-binding protein